MAKILVVDQGRVTRKCLVDTLTYEGYTADAVVSAKDCFIKLEEERYDLIIAQAEAEGVEILSKLTDMGISTPVLMTIEESKSLDKGIDLIVNCTKHGAADFVVRPFDVGVFLFRVRKVLNNEVTKKECKILRSQNKTGLPEIIGSSEKMLDIKQMINKVADTEARVLITGENGTGKELVAKWLHALGRRNSGPIIEVNCAAIPSDLIESELFGHEKGSFTSANCKHNGKFEQANGGTIFLDEIGDMSLSAQAKVLRALQEKRITRVGGTKDVSVDVRVIAATNKNLRDEISKGNFREDLYHRLNVIPIHVPALRSRASDIPMLVKQFIIDVCAQEHKEVKSISDEAMSMLQKYEWPGNVRELHNVVERLVILSDGTINKSDFEQHSFLV